MKKFLTLALALVMALALAAPAMAFVDFEYTADSKYALTDFYLVDYQDNLGLFQGAGLFTELPEADRGYLKNELVGAVVEVLVPARNTGNDAALRISGENVSLRTYVDDAKSSTTTVNKLGAGYTWEWDNVNERIFLVPPTGVDIFSTTSGSDVEAAWVVFGRVTADEATLTATLLDSTEYNTNLKINVPTVVGTSTSAKYEINGNKYDLTLTKTASGYEYLIEPKEGANDRGYVRLLTDSKWVSKNMIVSMTGVVNGYDWSTATAAKYTFNTDGTWQADANVVFNGVTYYFNAPQGEVPANQVYGLDTQQKLQDAIAAKLTAAGVGAQWSVAADDTTATQINVTAVSKGKVGSFGPAALVAGGFTPNDGKDPTAAAVTAPVYDVDEQSDLYEILTWLANGRPGTVNASATKDNDAAALLADVCADFGMDPAKVGNAVKPEYLGQFRRGNVIGELTIEIQPWQAYVTIPDIEVIDPPKTGDAATLAGFVMIVLAAAGVVVFKKVRA